MVKQNYSKMSKKQLEKLIKDLEFRITRSYGVIEKTKINEKEKKNGL